MKHSSAPILWVPPVVWLADTYRAYMQKQELMIHSEYKSIWISMQSTKIS